MWMETSIATKTRYEQTIVEWGVRYDTVIPGLPILGDRMYLLAIAVRTTKRTPGPALMTMRNLLIT